MTTIGEQIAALPHAGKGPPGWTCNCGETFEDYYGLAEHLRRLRHCPRCKAAAVPDLAEGEMDRWTCGHWIKRHDPLAILRPVEHHLTFIEVDSMSIARGGSCRTAKCICDWTGPQRASMTLAADDALEHEHAHGRDEGRVVLRNGDS